MAQRHQAAADSAAACGMPRTLHGASGSCGRHCQGQLLDTLACAMAGACRWWAGRGGGGGSRAAFT